MYPFRYSFVADHFQYLATLGIIVPVAYALAGHRGVAGIVIAILAVLTWRQAAMYRDAETLYSETIARNPECWMAYMNLGTLLTEVPDRLPQAIAAYEGALRVRPDYPEARRNLALAHYTLGNALSAKGLPGAVREYEASLALDPRNAEAHVNLGSELSELPGRLPDALAHYQAALSIKPDYFQAHYNLGTLLLDIPERHQEAVSHLQAALDIEPDSPEAHVNIAVALADVPGKEPEAIRHLEIALARRPHLAQAREFLAELRNRVARSR